jgi:phosphate transport system substrate-binding protein
MLKQLPVSLSLLASQLPGIATGFVTGCFVTWLFLVYYHLAKPIYSTPQQHSINTDGSSTVFPITNEVAKEYQVDGENKPEIPIHFSGTTSGFKKFCTGETDINNASRPILKTEMETCKANGVNYIELPIGYDPLTVVVNSENNWINSITINELKKIWEPQAEGKVKNWSQVRLNLPDKPLYLFGPGSDSGTFDFFTAETVGQARVTRKDYDGREDDGVVVEKVISKSPFALAYFGYHYYLQNSNKLKALAIDSGSGAIKPSPETVRNHSYPLTRPLFIYVNAESAKKRSEVRDFVKYYINNAKNFVEKVGYVPLPDRLYSKVLTHFEENKVGTVFDGKLQFNIDIEEFLQKKAEF